MKKISEILKRSACFQNIHFSYNRRLIGGQVFYAVMQKQLVCCRWSKDIGQIKQDLLPGFTEKSSAKIDPRENGCGILFIS
jgi:hypothetical protein